MEDEGGFFFTRYDCEDCGCIREVEDDEYIGGSGNGQWDEIYFGFNRTDTPFLFHHQFATGVWGPGGPEYDLKRRPTRAVVDFTKLSGKPKAVKQ